MSGHLAADVLFEALYVRVRPGGGEGTGSAAPPVRAAIRDDGAVDMSVAVFKGKEPGATGSAVAVRESTDQSSAVAQPRDGTNDSAQSQSLVTTTGSIIPWNTWILASYNYWTNKMVVNSNAQDKESERKRRHELQLLGIVDDSVLRNNIAVGLLQQMAEAERNIEKQREWERHVRNYAFAVAFAAVVFALRYVLASQTFGNLGKTSTALSSAAVNAAETMNFTSSDTKEVAKESTGIVRDLIKGTSAALRDPKEAMMKAWKYVRETKMFASGEDPPETSRAEPILPETLDALTNLVETFYPVILKSVLEQEAFGHITAADRKALYAFYSP